jgi:putative phosphoesterase
MKIIIFSDLHANWEALSALQRAESQPDAILFMGDVVNFGPDPQGCLDWVRANVTAAVRGNHDHAVAFGGDAGVNPALLPVFTAARDYTQSVLSEVDRAWLGELPLGQSIELDGRRFHLVHAMPSEPLGKRVSLVTAREDDLEAELALLDPRPDVLLVGHTHLPGMRQVGGTVIVNPGSLGQPRNGTPDATYAVWRDGALQIHHLHYDHDTTQRKLMSLPLDPDVVDRLQEILATGSA